MVEPVGVDGVVVHAASAAHRSICLVIRHWSPVSASPLAADTTRNQACEDLARQIPASPAEVYDVWIDPTCPGGPWFGPNNEHQKSKVIFDGKVDGLLYHSVTAQAQSWFRARAA